MNLLTRMVLVLIAVAYIVIGGVIFHLLEGKNETAEMQNVTAMLIDFFDSNECVNHAEFEAVIKKTLTVFRSGSFSLMMNGTGVEVDQSQTQWDYYSAIFFAMTVVSTIGYGNISPTTWQGRVFCVAFAIVGIPLFLVVVANIGSNLLSIVKKCQNCCFRRHRDGEKVPKKQKICGSIFVSILGVALFVVVPGVIFGLLEDWSYPEGIYYSFITLTTIGFGDFVAGQGGEYSGFRAIYRLCTVGWIFLGLAWMAGIISSIQEHFTSSIESKESAAQSTQGSRHNSRSEIRINTVDRRNDRLGSDQTRVFHVDMDTSRRVSSTPSRDMMRCYSVESAVTNNSQHELVRPSAEVVSNGNGKVADGALNHNGHIPLNTTVEDEDVFLTKL